MVYERAISTKVITSKAEWFVLGSHGVVLCRAIFYSELNSQVGANLKVCLLTFVLHSAFKLSKKKIQSCRNICMRVWASMSIWSINSK